MSNYAKKGFNMVNEERLRPMVKMAMFDKNEGKRCKPMIEYAREDYVAKELMKSFVSGTIAFMLCIGVWVIQDVERALGMLNVSKLRGFVMSVAFRYLIFMLVYLIITYIVYQIRYTQGRKKVKKYYSNLKSVNKMYEREEKIRTRVEDR